MFGRPKETTALVAGEHHAGVVFTTQKRWPRSDPGGLINALDELLKAMEDETVDSEIWL